MQVPKRVLENFLNYNLHYKVIHEHSSPQLTTGGRSDAEIATPINGPADPCSKATATPLPEVKAHKIPIHNDLALPLPFISSVGKSPKPQGISVVPRISPNINPKRQLINIPTASETKPTFYKIRVI